MEAALQRRILLLPLAWGAFGVGEVYLLSYLFGDIVNIAATAPNDKPIGGSVLPVLFSNTAVLLAIIAVSLYAVGFWRVDLSTRKSRMDVGALAVLLVSGFLLWYTAIAVFPVIVSLGYLIAVNIE